MRTLTVEDREEDAGEILPNWCVVVDGETVAYCRDEQMAQFIEGACNEREERLEDGRASDRLGGAA